MTACYCGGHYRCETCRRDVCFCPGHEDPTPDAQEAVTSGYTHPAQPGIDAWAEKKELTS